MTAPLDLSFESLTLAGHWSDTLAYWIGPDRQRFRRLMAVALMRAQERRRSVLLAAKPGWSYDHARAFGNQTRSLMASAGFVVLDRKLVVLDRKEV